MRTNDTTSRHPAGPGPAASRRLLRRTAFAAATAVVATLVPGPQAVGAPRSAVLATTRHPVLFSGRIAHDSPSTAPAACGGAPCDRFDVTVDLPGGAWNHKPGGLEISVRWQSLFDTLGLVVHRDGAPVAEASAPFATAQSVHIPGAANGTYTVWIVYDAQNSTSPAIDYEALAEVEYGPKPQPSRLLLPDLAVRPQRNVTFDTPPGFFEPDPEPGETCLPTEVAEGARTCLRFDLPVANAGEGPLEMRLPLPRAGAATGGTATQRLYGSGTADPVDRPAGAFEFHPAHDHYHYASFALTRLWAADGRGRQAGTAPVRTSGKLSFCVVDIEIDVWAAKGNGPRTYGFPSCLEPTASDDDFDYLVQGITPGWADIYDWFLPGQYIEVTGVADGTYVLDTVVDPDTTILERTTSNNCTSVLVRLAGVGTPARSAALVGPGPAC